MKKSKINKIILNSSQWLLITNIVIVYGTFFLSYINKDELKQYTSFPWYTNIILISVILTLPTLIFGFMYQYYHKKIYSKLSSTLYLIALSIFMLAIFLGMINCFIGKIPFFIIASFFLIALVFFIITLIHTVIVYLR